jgi:hypothetical protein
MIRTKAQNATLQTLKAEHGHPVFSQLIRQTGDLCVQFAETSPLYIQRDGTVA